MRLICVLLISLALNYAFNKEQTRADQILCQTVPTRTINFLISRAQNNLLLYRDLYYVTYTSYLINNETL